MPLPTLPGSTKLENSTPIAGTLAEFATVIVFAPRIPLTIYVVFGSTGTHTIAFTSYAATVVLEEVMNPHNES